MPSKRIYINLVVFLVASFALVYLGASNLVLQDRSGKTLFAEFVDASGLLPRNDVTMRGVVVGSVDQVELNESGNVTAEFAIDPGIEVPEGTIGEVVRRSPIGELTLELVPGEGDPLPDGATIPIDDTVPPPDVSRTFEILADIMHEVPSEDLHTVVSELAQAVRGRGRDLARFNVAAADLPERLLEVDAQLEQLITTGPEVTGVLADNADVLADDITETKLLADVLRDRRFDLVDLSRNGADFFTVAGDLISQEKPNLSCLISDFGDVNAVMARPKNLKNLAATLDKNHYFFDAVEQAVVVGKDDGTWFRVQVLPHQEPAGRSYTPHRDVPDVFGGNACRSPYGTGVTAARQQTPVDLARESKLHRGR